MKYYIWSYRHQAWWRAERSGYTNKVTEAGQYDKTDAAEISLGGLPGANVAVDTHFADKFTEKSAKQVETLLGELRRI